MGLQTLSNAVGTPLYTRASPLDTPLSRIWAAHVSLQIPAHLPSPSMPWPAHDPYFVGVYPSPHSHAGWWSTPLRMGECE